jgi:hypothetical protein
MEFQVSSLFEVTIRNSCFTFLLYGKFYRNYYRVSYSDGIFFMGIQVADLLQR